MAGNVHTAEIQLSCVSVLSIVALILTCSFGSVAVAQVDAFVPVFQVMQGSEALGFPHYIGAISGCHIFIKAPAQDADAYYYRKRHHSRLLQGTIDHHGIFVDVSVTLAGIMMLTFFAALISLTTWTRGIGYQGI